MTPDLPEETVQPLQGEGEVWKRRLDRAEAVLREIADTPVCWDGRISVNEKLRAQSYFTKGRESSSERHERQLAR